MLEAQAIARDGVRREALFFASSSELLYGSFYAAPEPEVGLVLCPSWGWEMLQKRGGEHPLARELARRGAAAFLFHWPGHGDSGGDSHSVGVPAMADAAADALALARDRWPGPSWGMLGVRLGAAAAAMAVDRVGGDPLVLLQPSLDPRRYFEEVMRASRRSQLGGQATLDWSFGHPVPPAGIRGEGAEDAAQALGRFRGRVIAFRYERPPGDPLPEGITTRSVPGDWRREGARGARALMAETLSWLGLGVPV